MVTILTSLGPTQVLIGRIIILAVIIGVVLLCVLPGKIKKRKIEKLDQENVEAKNDATKMESLICPICNNPFQRIDKRRQVMDNGARLIGGTYFAPEYSSRNDFDLKCDHCHYVISYKESRSVDHDHYDSNGNAKIVYSYSSDVSFLYLSTEETKRRINNARKYQSKKSQIEKKYDI